MQIVVHVGAHATDEERLIRCLISNRPVLEPMGIAVPPPGLYRRSLRDALRRKTMNPRFDFDREAFLDALQLPANTNRLIVSGQNLMGVADRIFEGDILYGLMRDRLPALPLLFEGDDIEVFMGLRNPATFIPAAFQYVTGPEEEDFLGDTNLYSMRWSSLIQDIQDSCPALKLTAWCNEDLPLVFGRIARTMAGIGTSPRLEGVYDILSDVLSGEGYSNLQSYMAAHPPLTDAHEQRVISAFADRFESESVEEEIDLPGWSEQLVDDLTTIYDDDFDRLRALSNLRFIGPF